MEKEIKESIYKNLQIDRNAKFVPKWGKKPAISVESLVNCLLEFESGPKAMSVLGRSPQSFNRNIRKLFPDVFLNGGGQSWKHWLISQSDYKKCSSCHLFKLKSSFTKDNSTYDNLDSECKDCKSISNKNWYDLNKESYHKSYVEENRTDYNARTAKRRAAKLQATPRWANLVTIREFYRNCPKGYHVDHVVPLQGVNVCGLHVENNLQYLSAKDNLIKGNNFESVA